MTVTVIQTLNVGILTRISERSVAQSHSKSTLNQSAQRLLSSNDLYFHLSWRKILAFLLLPCQLFQTEMLD